MRRLLLTLALVACSAGRSHGPAWPAASTTGDDGGESIAPRESSKVAAAVESTDEGDAKPAAPAVTVPAAVPASDGAAPAVAPAAAPPTVEDIFINEEITIEIDD